MTERLFGWKLVYAVTDEPSARAVREVEEPGETERKPVSMTVQLDPVSEGEDDDD